MKDLSKLIPCPDLVVNFQKDPQSFKESNPETWENLINLYGLSEEIRKKSAIRGRQIIARWLLRTMGNMVKTRDIYGEFESAIIAVKRFRFHLVREFIPDVLRFPFTSDGIAMPTNDPLELLKMIWLPEGAECLEESRSFDAYLCWQLGVRYLLMRASNNLVGEQLKKFTLLLETDLFVDDILEKSAEIVYYNPKNFCRFATKGKHKTEVILRKRLIQDQYRTLRVMYENRVKTEDDVFRKILLRGTLANPAVTDICALSFIFFSEEDSERGAEILREKIFSKGGIITNRKSRRDENKNIYSASESLPEQKFIVFINGGWVEAHIYSFPQWFNRRFSLGEENHHLYRLRQVVDLFKIIYPKELYIDWGDPAINNLLRGLQISRIKSNFP